MSYRSTLRLLYLAGLVFIVSAFPLAGYSTDAVGAAGSHQLFLPVISTSPAVWRPFSSTSPWNVPIAANAQVDSNSPAMIAHLMTSQDPRFWINLYWAGVTVWYADSSTPKYTVKCSLGNCADLTSVPIPNGAVPDPSSDGLMTIIDLGQLRSYDMYQPQRAADGSWVAGWGTTFDLSGTGVKPRGQSGARAAGTPLAAGLIRPDEIRAGRINHALVFSYDYPGPCLVSPASVNGGSSKDPNAMPMGARVQLDPGLDLNTLGLSQGGKVVAKALQEYGMYVVDNGPGISLYGESFPGNSGSDPWNGVLKENDLVKLPSNRLRVLKLAPQDCALP